MSPLKLIISTMLPETLVVRPAASAAPPAAACVEARVLEEAVDNQGMGGWGARARQRPSPRNADKGALSGALSEHRTSTGTATPPQSCSASFAFRCGGAECVRGSCGEACIAALERAGTIYESRRGCWHARTCAPVRATFEPVRMMSTLPLPPGTGRGESATTCACAKTGKDRHSRRPTAKAAESRPGARARMRALPNGRGSCGWRGRRAAARAPPHASSVCIRHLALPTPQTCQKIPFR